MYGVQGMSLTKGIIFGKYVVTHNEDQLCKGSRKDGVCHCTFTISVGLPTDAGQMCWRWHDNPDWRKCVPLVDWLSGLLRPEECGPTSREDDFAGKQEWIEVVG